MKRWLPSTLAVLILSALVFLIYRPLLKNDLSESTTFRQHQTDAMQPGREGTLSFCSDVSPPFVNAQGGAQEGYAVELLREIYEPLGYFLEFEIAPQNLCLEKIQSGSITAVVGMTQREAPDLIFPEEAMAEYHPMFYTLSQSQWTYQGLASLGTVRLGVRHNYSYSDELDTYIEQYQLTDRLMFSRGEQPLALLLNALQNGELDTFIEDQCTVDAFLKNHPEMKGNLRTAGSLETGTRLYVAFNPGEEQSELLGQRYDRRLDVLHRNGLVAQILSSYNLECWQENSARLSSAQLGERPH